MLKKIIENNFYLYGIGTVGSLLFLVAAYQDLTDFISRQAVVGYNLVFFMLAFGLFLNEFKPKKEEVEEEVYISSNAQNSYQEYPKFVDNLYNPDDKNEWEIEEEEEEDKHNKSQEEKNDNEIEEKKQDKKVKVENPWAKKQQAENMEDIPAEAVGFIPEDNDTPPVG